jgi:NADH dehydrogenase
MHTVIIGGGFAGVKTALELSKKQLGKITLVSDEPYFLHHATLYATATGRDAGASVIDLEDMFALHHDVEIIHDSMKSLDWQRKIVVCKTHDIHYDSLVLALGSVTNYFGIKGMERHSYGIKTLEEVTKLRTHLHGEVVENQHNSNSYFIIGGGPTGVELAAAIAEYVRDVAAAHHVKRGTPKITLVEAASRLLPKLSYTASHKTTRQLQTLGVHVMVDHKVEALDDDAVTIDGKKWPSKTVIWTSGVKNNPFFIGHPEYFTLSDNGRVKVNRYLETFKDVYVLGDNADTRYSGRAYTALQDAVFVADHLERRAVKKPLRPYQPSRVSQSVPVGHSWAYVEKYGIYLAGRSGYLVRRLIELANLRALLPHNQALSAWHAYDKQDGSCELCKSSSDSKVEKA